MTMTFTSSENDGGLSAAIHCVRPFAVPPLPSVKVDVGQAVEHLDDSRREGVALRRHPCDESRPHGQVGETIESERIRDHGSYRTSLICEGHASVTDARSRSICDTAGDASRPCRRDLRDEPHYAIVAKVRDPKRLGSVIPR